MKAIDAYGKALELEANDANILTDQGVMYRRVGWYDKAITNFEKANALDRSHQQSSITLAWFTDMTCRTLKRRLMLGVDLSHSILLVQELTRSKRNWNS